MLITDFWTPFMRLVGFADQAPDVVQTAHLWLLQIANIVTIAGLTLALILLLLIVYVSIRLEQIEHEGFHRKEMGEHISHAQHVEVHVKNPRWEAIALLASSPNESDWRRAIMDADIMLSGMMREKGYTGTDIGEQFANANPLQFATIDIAREAHRMRNALAHLGEAFPLTERDARATIDQYRRVFEEFGYI